MTMARADEINAMRRKIIKLGKLMFDRNLTDTAGGNISARVGDVICITAAGCGSIYRWDITMDQVLVTDMNGEVLEGEGKISRESKVHYRLLNTFPEGRAVVHGHARNVLIFASAGVPMEPVLEGTLKFGLIPVVDYAPAHSDELAENMVRSMEGREAQVSRQAAVSIAPWHGLVALGKSLDAAFDAAERVEVNAHVTLHLGGLGVEPRESFARLREARSRFGG